MHKFIIKMTFLLLTQSILIANAVALNVGVSVAGEVQPGVYGRVDIGNASPPPVLYSQPLIIMQPSRAVTAAPLYLHVPPGHAKKWSKHCHQYNACAQPVYFVKSAEYGSDDKGKGRKPKHRHDH